MKFVVDGDKFSRNLQFFNKTCLPLRRKKEVISFLPGITWGN
jgi:hypothetical protein